MFCCIIIYSHYLLIIYFVGDGLCLVGVAPGEDFVGVTGVASLSSSSWTCMWYLYIVSVDWRFPVIQI